MNLNPFVITVVSMIFPSLPARLIPVEATNRHQAERFALDQAQHKYRIAAPIVVREKPIDPDAMLLNQLCQQFGGNERLAWSEFQRLMRALRGPKTPRNMDGNNVPFFRQHEARLSVGR